MINNTPRLEIDLALTKDSRWELVERIVASPLFVKSPRLCSFLSYICELSLQGRAEEINELSIGEALFDRSRNYDPSLDGIVRSHASRLRQKLEQYFSEEGRDEPISLRIPKGAYIPVFEPRPIAAVATEVAPAETLVTRTNLTIPLETPAFPIKSKRLALWILSLALVVACGTVSCLLVQLRTSTMAPPAPLASHPLWRNFFGPNHSAMILCSDAGLTTLGDLSRHNTNLAEYLSADYRTRVTASAGITAEVLKDLAARRYTSIVDLLVITRFYRLPGVHADQIRVHYSRDVRLNDLKGGFVILLGSQEANPWVEMFETGMNFTVRSNPDRQISSVINQSPRGGELLRYDSNQMDPQHKIYGLVALRHNLRGNRQALILEGTSMAGTEAASDFVFDDVRLLPFLNKIRNPDGSIPYFEVLLQSSNMNGNASQSEIIAYRTSQQ